MELSIFWGKRDPAPILLQSWRKRGHGQHTFLRRVPVEDDPGQVEHGDEPEAGEQQVDEQQEADDSCGTGQGVSGWVAPRDPPQPPTHSPSSRKLSTHCSTARSWSAELTSRCEGQGTASSVLRAVWMLARLPAERGTRPHPEQRGSYAGGTTAMPGGTQGQRWEVGWEG